MQTNEQVLGMVYKIRDGQRNVGGVGKLVEKEFSEDANPIYERLLLFLNHIHVNKKYGTLVEG